MLTESLYTHQLYRWQHPAEYCATRWKRKANWKIWLSCAVMQNYSDVLSVWHWIKLCNNYENGLINSCWWQSVTTDIRCLFFLLDFTEFQINAVVVTSKSSVKAVVRWVYGHVAFKVTIRVRGRVQKYKLTSPLQLVFFPPFLALQHWPLVNSWSCTTDLFLKYIRILIYIRFRHYMYSREREKKKERTFEKLTWNTFQWPWYLEQRAAPSIVSNLYSSMAN